jgi:hypothetical protein
MRHIPDDFSHLPTVDEDSVDGLDAIREKPPAVEQPQASQSFTSEPEDSPKVEALPEVPQAPEPEQEPVTARLPALGRIIEAPKAPSADGEAEAPQSTCVVVPRPLPKQPAASSSPLVRLSGSSNSSRPAAEKKPVEQAKTESPVGAEPPLVAPVVFKPPGSVKSGEASDAPLVPPDSLRERWEKWGGRTLALSFGIHLLLLVTGSLIVVHQTMDKQVDFLPGGSSAQGQKASNDLNHKIQQKKNPWLKKSVPIRKLAVEGAIKNIVLPTDVPDMLDIPDTMKPLGGGLLGGGFGLDGAGGGFGKGLGLGGQNGMVFGPLFGLDIKAKKLAVVLDISGSMTPHLSRVVTEVDKVAKGSVVVLFVGCGVQAPVKPLVGTKIFRTSGVEFEKFWRMGPDSASFVEASKFKYKSKDPIPSEDIFRMLAKRPQTYFIHNVGVSYAWLALLSEEVRNADGLYWFSDFQDTVEYKQATIVLDNLMRRKQRLYIHSYGKGQYFDIVKNQIVTITKGDSYIEE